MDTLRTHFRERVSRAHQSAYKDAEGHPRSRLISAAAVTSVSTGVAFFIKGVSGVIEAAQSIGVGIATFAVCYIAVFLWNFIYSTPKKMILEAYSERDTALGRANAAEAKARDLVTPRIRV